MKGGACGTYLLKDVSRSGETGELYSRRGGLGYAQSSVTTQIQRLEESYGVVLMERFGRNMKLTLAGETLLQYANEIHRIHEESKEAVSRQSKGTLSIGTVETLAAFYLPPYLGAYRRDFPDVNVMIQPGNESEIIQAVKEGELDFGIILDLPFADEEFDIHVLREEPLDIIVSPDHKLAGQTEIRIGELESESLILTEDGCTYRAMLLRMLKGNRISYRLAYEFGNLEAIKQCVINGLGIALLPRIAVAAEIRNGQVIGIPFVDPACQFYTQLIYPKKNGSRMRSSDLLSSSAA